MNSQWTYTRQASLKLRNTMHKESAGLTIIPKVLTIALFPVRINWTTVALRSENGNDRFGKNMLNEGCTHSLW